MRQTVPFAGFACAALVTAALVCALALGLAILTFNAGCVRVRPVESAELELRLKSRAPNDAGTSASDAPTSAGALLPEA